MKKSRIFAAALVACGFVSTCPAAELLTNGSFEDVKDGKTVGWNVPEHYAFADGVGMNGTRALVFENRDDKEFYKYPSERFLSGRFRRYARLDPAEGRDAADPVRGGEGSSRVPGLEGRARQGVVR